jgi:hypothetical protein
VTGGARRVYTNGVAGTYITLPAGDNKYRVAGGGGLTPIQGAAFAAVTNSLEFVSGDIELATSTFRL